ncbi:DNA-processing protein DprA [Alteromonas sp. ASW11-19]|uniref:DNA-processing protein DprA n=1 Tax=Alteromonas salexigens TaxID=2982530 RepID=A0ABT2VK42_9ALTE|nr:DNA-processing protein DprA [Alteromonas salexigens]MCU7553640.1 DNA-processing protein DprA [Alteromonas salexigens]
MTLTSSPEIVARNWLTLSVCPGTKPADWLALLDQTGLTPDKLVATPEPALSEAWPAYQNLFTLLTASDNVHVHSALEWAAADPCHYLVGYSDPRYPALLKHLRHPPLLLYCMGNLACLGRPQLAVVGSRRATIAGKANATAMAADLSQRGITVVSGLATGVDKAAHEGALRGEGSTIAVIGTGPDQTYPRQHVSLQQAILDGGGCLVSEYPPGTPPRPYHFPRRNRLIAAMSLGTLVVEAKIRSGTLITANLAANMGKDVFAIPGNIQNPQTEGCHWLIQQGAKLVTGIDDILDELPAVAAETGLAGDTDPQKSEVNSLATDKLLASVDLDVTPVDVIAERNTLPVSAVMAALLEYELRGLVAAVPGGYVKLRGK